MMSQRERYALVALLSLFFILATVYNVVSTPFEAPDEIGHFYYVAHLLQERRLPVVPSDEPPPNYEHEGVQPPLYYAGGALFVQALSAPLGLDLEDADAPLDVNPHSTCGQPGARHNVNYLAHDPHREQFPYRGRIRVLHILRLWSSLLATATVAGIFAVVRLVFPRRPAVAWLAAGLAAFTPEFLFTAGAVSNDNMVTALSTWGLVVALRTLDQGLHWRRALGLGLLAGLAALSKFSGTLLLPLAWFVIFLAAARPRASTRPTEPLRHRLPAIIGHASLVTSTFVAVAGWWFYRNWSLYGDLTGTSALLALLPLRDQMSVGIFVRELGGLFRSWWGVFGCTMPPDGFYLFYLAFTVVGLAGLVADYRRLRQKWMPVVVLLAWLALMFVAYIRWNWVIHAPKGRLLYPAMASAAALLGYGWAHWTARRSRSVPALLTLLALAAGFVPWVVMAPLVSPPPVYADPDDVDPQHPLNGRFGPNIALLGYDLNGNTFEPGQALDLTLYWQALAPPADRYTLAIQLLSAVPGETDTLVNYNTWTGGGSYPTDFWRSGDVVADHYRLQLPPAVSHAQAWHLQVVLFDPADGARLPFELVGGVIGESARLATVRVGASDPAAALSSPEDRLEAPYYFGDAILLEGVRVEREERMLTLTLWWHSIASLDQDFTVFVHLYDAQGELIATADGPPLAGGFPTSLWRPGDRLRETRVVLWSTEAEAPLQLGVGWYDPTTELRLMATTAEGTRLPDDVVPIPVKP